MKGRKPTPTRLRLIQGNPGKRALPKDEPQPDPRIPEMPDWLKAPAAEEWRRVTGELAALDLISELDMAMLAKYCAAYADVVELQELIEREGWFVPTAEGGRKRNPAAASLNEAWNRLTSAAVEFGMTPAARVRLATPGEKERDPLDELIQRKRERR